MHSFIKLQLQVGMCVFPVKTLISTEDLLGLGGLGALHVASIGAATFGSVCSGCSCRVNGPGTLVLRDVKDGGREIIQGSSGDAARPGDILRQSCGNHGQGLIRTDRPT